MCSDTSTRFSSTFRIDDERLFICILTIGISAPEECPLEPFAHFSIGLSVFSYSFVCSLYILYASSISFLSVTFHSFNGVL